MLRAIFYRRWQIHINQVQGAAAPPPPGYTPALKFNDKRNSMYLPAL